MALAVPEPQLSDHDLQELIGLIRDATRMSQFKLQRRGAYTVTGAPVVLAELTRSITSSIVGLRT